MTRRRARKGRPAWGMAVRLVALAGSFAVLVAVAAVSATPAAAATPPANDEISGASNVAALPFSATQDSLDATQSPSDPAPSCGAANNYTVWYSYTPSADGTIQASTSGGDYFPPTPTAFTGPANATSASPLAEAACSSSGTLQLNVSAGTTYYFMLGSYSPRPSFTFTVQAIVPPANDEISNATPVDALPFNATQDSLTATRNPSDPTPSCGAPSSYTVWYSYTPSADGAVLVSTSGGDYFPPSPTAYMGPANATPTSPLTQVACASSGPVQLSVSAGTTYYFMLSSFSPRPSFTFTVQAIVTPPNDEITNATPIAALPFSASQDLQYATQNPHDPTPSCGAPNNHSVWYSYTAAADGAIQVTTSVNSGYSPTASVYIGPPGATPTSPLTEADCGSTSWPGQLSVTAGTTYYIMVAGLTFPGTLFTLNVQTIVPPANDEITNATPIGTLPFTATQDNINATRNPSDPTLSCHPPSGGTKYTVWYSYIPNANGTIQATTSGGSPYSPAPTAYTGPANATPASPLTEVACSTYGGPLQLNVIAGTTYYFMLGSYSPLPAFTFTVEAIVPPPNDAITNATPIGALPYTATDNNQFATQDPHDPTPSCGAPNSHTVWYSYTPNADELIQVTTTSSGTTPTAYSGPANATPTTALTEVGCSTYLPLQVNVTAGTTYYFMLGSYGYGTPSSFTLNVNIAVPLAPPTITAPPISVGTDPGQCGASVSYGDLIVAGNPPPSVYVSPPSGSSFGLGTSYVYVSASNALGYTSTSFPVTVSDTEPPQVTAPASVTVDATGPAGATVNYPPFTATDNCPGVNLTSTPGSASTFAIGNTVVTGTATDAAGNHATATFTIHVNGAGEQLAALKTAVTGIGAGSSLTASLNTAQTQLAKRHTSAACQAIRVFINQVAVQTPGHINPATAQALTTDAQRILAVLNC